MLLLEKLCKKVLYIMAKLFFNQKLFHFFCHKCSKLRHSEMYTIYGILYTLYGRDCSEEEKKAKHGNLNYNYPFSSFIIINFYSIKNFNSAKHTTMKILIENIIFDNKYLCRNSYKMEKVKITTMWEIKN